MGFLKNFLKLVSGQRNTDTIFVPSIGRAGGEPATPLVADETYIQLFIDSLRIEKSRAFATTFHGAVYSFATLAKQGEGTTQFAGVSRPDRLADLDDNAIGKVITVSRRMMGATPWRGGTFDLELGLFSIKSGNLLTPLLGFVTKVSETAGISFVGAAKPFIPLISEGMDLIAGQTSDTKLVVGIDTSLTPTHSATMAIIAKDKTKLDVAQVTLDPTDGKLLLAGRPLEASYCVFSLRATATKADFGEIPELKKSFDDFRKAIVDGEEAKARDTFAAFRRTALSSPELIARDAQGLVAKLKDMLDGVFPPAEAPGLRQRGGDGGPATTIPATLAEVPLYE